MNAKLVLAGLLLVAGTVVALAGASPEAALTPSQAQAATADRDHVAVKGSVAELDRANRSFVLVDEAGGRIDVTLGHELPVQAREGAQLVAKGALVVEDGQVTLRASEVLIGCPSKYE